jgi:UDP:flavonoid glycosyltransferase YjiC (YdhE family)
VGRVYFGVCGIGYGHIGRCLPLAEGLDKNGFDILISTYGEALKLLNMYKFKSRAAPPMGFQVRPDGSVDFKLTMVNPGPFLAFIKFVRQLGFEYAMMQLFQPDVVVSDTRASTVLSSRILDIPCITILNQFKIITPVKKPLFKKLALLLDTGSIAFIGAIWSLSDFILIPDYPYPYTISSGNLEIPEIYADHVKLIGPIVDVKPADLPSVEELKDRLGVGVDKPLIFTPISGPRRERLPLVEKLKPIFMKLSSYYDIVMCIGDSEYGSRPLEDHDGFKIYGWTDRYYEYLKACDVLVCRAGHGTLSKAILYGKPSLVIPTPNHTEQMGNAKRMEEMGLSIVLDQGALDVDRVASALRCLYEDKGLEERIVEASRFASVHDGLEAALKYIKHFT